MSCAFSTATSWMMESSNMTRIVPSSGMLSPNPIVIGNPAKVLRKRFDDELINLLLAFKWWDKEIEEINALIPLLTCSDLEKAKKELSARL